EGHEGIAARVGPDLAARRRRERWPARVEAVDVRDDERVRADGEAPGRWEAESGQLLFADAQRALGGVAILAAPGDEALRVLPAQPRERRAMRARHVGEGAGVLGHVVEEVPGLHRRVEGVGVE